MAKKFYLLLRAPKGRVLHATTHTTDDVVAFGMTLCGRMISGYIIAPDQTQEVCKACGRAMTISD